jgi:hypothetical protein
LPIGKVGIKLFAIFLTPVLITKKLMNAMYMPWKTPQEGITHILTSPRMNLKMEREGRWSQTPLKMQLRRLTRAP